MCPQNNSGPPTSITIIIPVWRDSTALQTTLPRTLAACPCQPVIVVSAEADPAAKAVTEASGVKWMQASGKSRALQMNEAAARADSAALLFLHADTILPIDALPSIQQALTAGCVGGAFARRFEPAGLFLNLTCRLADWRGQLFGWFLGDQAIFVRRDIFQMLDGFQHRDSFEDLDFARRMSRVGKTRLLKPGVLTSARRFAKLGPPRQTLRDFMATMHYLKNGRDGIPLSDTKQQSRNQMDRSCPL